jgi:SAM-dependent methyltransferase
VVLGINKSNTQGYIMEIIYLPTGNEWFDYPDFVIGLVHQYGLRQICDVGGGANPILPLQLVNDHQLDCTILDISSTELAKGPREYKKLVQDIEAENFTLIDQFDLVITKMMAEHVRNGRLFHENIFSMLKPGGVAVHYFPTLYAFPFLINRFIPEWLSSFLLGVFLPRDRYLLGKFRAYYRWCYGPTPFMLKMLTKIGYEIILYKGIFGHIYYDRVPVLRTLHSAYTQYLAKHPTPYLTSFAQVILRKPENSLSLN